MNADKIKGTLQKAGGHIEEAAGALVGSENLKVAGKEDQLEGSAREAWGNVKDAGNNLIDQARVAKYDAQTKSDLAQAYEKQHAVEVNTDLESDPEQK